MSKVYVDIGHGGKDPGAVSEGIKEAVQAYKWGYMLIDELNTYNSITEVIFSRKKGEYISLRDRAVEANITNCDYFISLHFNAFNNPAAQGIETYHFPTSTMGKKTADAIQRDLINNTDLTNRGTKSARFYVLRKTSMPAVLIEAGFITNPKERELIRSDEYLNVIAKSVAKSVDTLVS